MNNTEKEQRPQCRQHQFHQKVHDHRSGRSGNRQPAPRDWSCNQERFLETLLRGRLEDSYQRPCLGDYRPDPRQRGRSARLMGTEKAFSGTGPGRIPARSQARDLQESPQ